MSRFKRTPMRLADGSLGLVRIGYATNTQINRGLVAVVRIVRAIGKDNGVQVMRTELRVDPGETDASVYRRAVEAAQAYLDATRILIK